MRALLYHMLSSGSLKFKQYTKLGAIVYLRIYCICLSLKLLDPQYIYIYIPGLFSYCNESLLFILRSSSLFILIALLVYVNQKAPRRGIDFKLDDLASALVS